MKPILLQAHERSLTKVLYNKDGDLLFTASKHNLPNVWWSINGERLGTYNGHNGAVWDMAVSSDSTKLLSASADQSCIVWDSETGKILHQLEAKSPVRSCGFSLTDNILCFTTDKAMGQPCFVKFFDIRDKEQVQSNTPFQDIQIEDSKVNRMIWGTVEDYIITGHENGQICQYDWKTEQCSSPVPKTPPAKLFDAKTFQFLKSYKTDRPVNSAAISPIKHHILLGGGQEAMEVTTSHTKSGKFEARFFHLIFEEEIGRVKGHFGPINTLAFHPNGKQYSSGAEDGYVRIHDFDQSYYDFEYDF
ncbi:eukaryotic translation initiation factor 3 subunit I-like [Bolinopsis microptera]|uniref:eukaryotic translation initiation factor 3 subunit I-like n=1 Tax=Bolinopsis microptera TaxID=2820187 RepID=UPI003078A911